MSYAKEASPRMVNTHNSGINLNVDQVLNIAKAITTLKIKLPASGETLTKTMLITPKHRMIKPLFDKNFGKRFRVLHCRSQETECFIFNDPVFVVNPSRPITRIAVF
jgi:hypothetical protein